MGESTEDLIKQFKSKVEEAISLLPQIPEVHRDEVWTYWQIISVAVKAAVGGRGPIVAKQTTASQGRRRGRPCLHAQQNDSVLGGGEKKQVDSVGEDIVARKIRRKSKPTKNIISGKKNKVDVWLSGQQCDGSRKSSRADSSEKPDRAKANHRTSRGDSGQSINLSPQSSISMAVEEPASPFIGNSTADKISSNVLIQEDITTSFSERESNSNILHVEFISGPVALETSAVESTQSVETLAHKTYVNLQKHAAEPFSSSSGAHDILEIESGEKQKSSIIENLRETESNSSTQTSEKVQNLVAEISQTLTATLSKTLQLELSTVGTTFEPGTASAEIVNSQTSVLNSGETCQTQGLVSESLVSFESDGLSQTLEKSASGVALTHKSVTLPAETSHSQVLTTSAIGTSQKQEINAEPLQVCLTEHIQKEMVTDSCKVADSTSNNINLGTKSACQSQIVLPNNCAVGVKRKRGRPPKHRSKQLQTSLASTSLLAQQSDKSPQVFVTCVESGSKVVDVSLSASETPSDLKSIIAALDLKEKKSITYTSYSEPPSVKVRRSVRRVIPNRDEMFCYFEPAHQGKVEGEKEQEEGKEEEEVKKEEEEYEEGSIGAEPLAEKLDSDGKVEEKKVKMKTEEEKIQERTCPTCHAVLMSASSLTAHMRIHTGERPFACPVCHKTFTTKGNCERHEVTHVGLKAFTCSQCNKKFTEKKSLKIHMRGHTGERPYQCKLCGTRFFQSGTLKTHMDRHTGHKGHLCELCGKAFRQSCQLRVHMLRHSMNMPYQCRHCCRTFYTKSDMERHELKHSGQRPFPCDQCPKTFTRLQYLREHQNTHLGRRPYRCVVCGLTFHDFASCHRHVSKHKMPNSDQPAQQIHVEVTPDTPTQQVMEQVQVILDQQNLTDYQASQIQTFIIPEQPASQNTSTTSATGLITQPSAHAILSNLGLQVEESSEIYHVTLVDPAQGVTVSTDQRQAPSVSVADFSAINLLANATTQLSAPP